LFPLPGLGTIFRVGANKQHVYLIRKTQQAAFDFAKGFRGGGVLDHTNPYPKKGPPHYHPKNHKGKIGKIHVTWESAADDHGLIDPEWQDWRQDGVAGGAIDVGHAMKMFTGFVYMFDPTGIHDILEAGETFGDEVVGPWVDEKRAERERGLKWWLEE
jgi:hypothetical protein